MDTAYRVVADHVRTCTISISDGAVPNNVGRGCVVRRVLRRGARLGRKYLNAEIGSFFSKIVLTVIEQLEDIFPEIPKNGKDVKEILDEEDQAFSLNLDGGEAMFNKYAQSCLSKSSKDLSGAYVWRLYGLHRFVSLFFPFELRTRILIGPNKAFNCICHHFFFVSSFCVF